MGHTAVVLEKTSRQLLTYAMRAAAHLDKKGYHLRSHSGPLPHHMTINLGEFDRTLNHPKILKSEYAELQVDALFWSNSLGAAAFRVVRAHAHGMASDEDWAAATDIKTLNDDNSHAHITVGLKDGVKAFRSNDLFGEDPLEDLNLYPFEEMLIVRGTIREVR